MVEELDYHMGKVFDFLSETDDPRWPGHKLVENTYVIFTSDNGGMEGHPGEIITDNYPLDKGKISLMEGGTRVPLIITGPGIPKGVESEVMVNGLDFYPTILSLTQSPKPRNKNLDGSDLSDLLLGDPCNPNLVKDRQGKMRDTMVWHFPNSAALESSIRVGGYKLVRNHNHKYNQNTDELELYHLYEQENGKQVRIDIEEAKNLVATNPELVRELDQKLSAELRAMKASFPYYNPQARTVGPDKKLVPQVVSHKLEGTNIRFSFKERGAQVRRAELIYTRNGGQRYEEWFRVVGPENPKVEVVFAKPAGSTHFFLNLIDENNFLVSYPQCPDYAALNKTKEKFAKYALPAK
jgi:uncharacterized sulfatase